MVSRVGLHRNTWHQYAWGSSPWNPGATTILKVQDAIRGSDQLMQWAVKTALEAVAQGKDHDAAKEAVNAARDRGTAVHAGIEAMIQRVDWTPSPDTFPYWYGWAKFLMVEQPTVLATEQMVINLTAGFGGTIDLIARLGDQTVQIDVKTGSPKPEHALQLAAYSAAEWMGAPDDPKKYPMPDFDAHYVLALMTEAPYYELIPLAVGEQEVDHFLYLTETYHRLKAWSKAA